MSEEGHKVTKVGMYKILKRFEGQGLSCAIQEDYTHTPKIILQVCTSELALLFCLPTARPYQMQTRCSIRINPVIMSVRKFEHARMCNRMLSVSIVVFHTKDGNGMT